MHTISQLLLLLLLPTLHSTHHLLLALDITDLCVDLLQILAQLGIKLTSNLGKEHLVLLDLLLQLIG